MLIILWVRNLDRSTEQFIIFPCDSIGPRGSKTDPLTCLQLWYYLLGGHLASFPHGFSLSIWSLTIHSPSLSFTFWGYLSKGQNQKLQDILSPKLGSHIVISATFYRSMQVTRPVKIQGRENQHYLLVQGEAKSHHKRACPQEELLQPFLVTTYHWSYNLNRSDRIITIQLSIF